SFVDFAMFIVFVCLFCFTLCFFIFFFSSRRRHTRSKRDWSSDVCSSDLPPACKAGALPAELRPHRCYMKMVGLGGLEPPTSRLRSEERRVGKECRSRWSTDA